MKKHAGTVAGILLLAAAMVVPGSYIEAALGRNPGDLSWGPTLFRAMLAMHGVLLFLWARRSWPEQPLLRWFRADGPYVIPILAGLTVIGGALRLWRLDTSLWLDEILTMVDFAQPPVTQIVTSFPNQNQHMLFSLLAHASLSAFGESAWALRLPSVFFGLASIWALYLLARRFLGVHESLLACTLMTVSYHHIWFSQNARGYMGVLFFSIVATWLWLEALEKRSARLWVAYSFALFGGMWIHLTILFVIAAHGVIWLWDSMRTRRIDLWPVTAWVLCGTLTVQALALSLPEFFRTALHEVSMPSEWTNPLWVLTESVRSLQIGFAGAAVVLAGGLFVAGGWFALWRQAPRAAWGMVLPALIGGAAMLMSGHNLWPRFFFFSMGFGLLIVVYGAHRLPQLLPIPSRLAARTGTALVALVVIASASTVSRCYAAPKQDFTGARAYVESRRVPGDAVAVVGLARHAYGKYYARHWSAVDKAEELQALRDKHAAVTLVYTLPIELKAFHPSVWEAVNRDFEPQAVFWGTLGGGEVYVCRERSRPAIVPATLKPFKETR